LLKKPRDTELTVGEVYEAINLLPKIVRFRMDKTVDEIDSVEKLKKLCELQYERYPTKSL